MNTKNNNSSHFNGGFSNVGSHFDNSNLHHCNASSHAALIVSELLTKMGVPMLFQPPCSHDLVPEDFFSFPKTKRTLKRTRHGTLKAHRLLIFARRACNKDLCVQRDPASTLPLGD
ncbi:hypothetical protein TNCT_241671 [Trichonephila clavata]|uniref:Transposase n=1 Tax=Trichonephila clavata TaxID=2740835 RepID=A0A8X6JYG2_TRICU|nr:hypothetical protein TNCT_241671 [Trichonephila clavata]